MDPDLMWMIARAPMFLLGVGLGVLGTLAWLECREDRLSVRLYRNGPDALELDRAREVDDEYDPHVVALLRRVGGR